MIASLGVGPVDRTPRGRITTTVSYWQTSRPTTRLTADAVVVGGGIVGSYASLLLREAGLDTVLLEARDLASGATGRNAGMVLLGLVDYYSLAVERYGRATARELWGLTVENRSRTLSLLQRLGLSYEPSGSLLLAVDDTEARVLEASARFLLDDGFDVEYVARDPLGRGFVNGLRQPDDLLIDPVRFSQALAAASGARVERDSEVYALENLPHGCRIHSKRCTIEARYAFVALNAYAPNLDPYFAPLVTPVRAQMLATAPAPGVINTALYANWGYEYLRQLADGTLLAGGGRKKYRHLEVGYDDTTTPDVQAAVSAFLGRYFPEVGPVVQRRWSGVMGFTSDGVPVVGTLPHAPAVGFAIGFNGHGLGIGLVTAERAVEQLLHGREPGVFDVARLRAS